MGEGQASRPAQHVHPLRIPQDFGRRAHEVMYLIHEDHLKRSKQRVRGSSKGHGYHRRTSYSLHGTGAPFPKRYPCLVRRFVPLLHGGSCVLADGPRAPSLRYSLCSSWAPTELLLKHLVRKRVAGVLEVMVTTVTRQRPTASVRVVAPRIAVRAAEYRVDVLAA